MKPRRKEAEMSFELPDLPYAKDALEPYMSAQTLEFHHGKHHNTYVTKANELIQGTGLEGKPLEQVVIESKKAGNQPLFNNAGQHYNHSFFWQCLSPDGGGEPPEPLAGKIKESFGAFDTFKEKFVAEAVGQFGSGWAWLVQNNGKLEIVKTANAETPLTEGKTPLFVVDVWEHAYYLDFQNRRPDFVKNLLDNLANWNFVNENLQNAG